MGGATVGVRYGSITDRLDLDAVAQEIFDLLVARIPAYARLPEPIRQEVAAITRRIVGLSIVGFATGRLPDGDDMEMVWRSARDRHAEGLPLEDLLRAYRLGSELLWQRILEAVGPGEEEVVGPFSTYYVTLVGRLTAGC